MAYVVDEKGNAKTTFNVVVPTLHDQIAAGRNAILLINGGVMYVDELVPVPRVLAGPG